jgi:hypothetical protein
MEVEKRKGEADQNTKRAGESKEKEKPRPCISKKWYYKRKTRRRKFRQKTGLPGYPTCLPRSALKRAILASNLAWSVSNTPIQEQIGGWNVLKRLNGLKVPYF